MASFITGLPFVVDAGTSAMVALKMKKDRMDMRVGSKLFNLGFIQKQLAKQLEPLKDEQVSQENDQQTKTLNEHENSNHDNETEIL